MLKLIIKYFLLFWFFSLCFWADQGVASTKIARNDKSNIFRFASPIVFFLRLAGRSYQTSENWLFSSCDQFPHDFGQIQARIIPYLIEVVKLSNIVVCRVVFVFICDHNRMEEYTNFRNSSFLSCSRWYPFLQVFSRSLCNLQSFHKKWLDMYFSLQE